MLVSAAVCPHPPLLVSGVGREGDEQTDTLRAACWSAVDAVRSSAPQVLVVVGVGESTATAVSGVGSFARFGVRRSVTLPGGEVAGEPDAADGTLPLSVGAWLLERDGWPGPVSAATIAADAGLTACLELGASLARTADRVGLLVMSDGSASRSDDAPRTFHPRAEEYDAAVARALGDGDPNQVTRLDPELAVAVGSTGLNALRVLAGAAADVVFDAEILYDAAPFGVGYMVGVWERHG